MTQKDKDFLEDMQRITNITNVETKCQKFCSWVQKIKNKLLFWRK